MELDASISSLEKRVEEMAGTVLGRDGALCLDEASVDALAEVMTPRLKVRRTGGLFSAAAAAAEEEVPAWRRAVRPQTSGGRLQGDDAGEDVGHAGAAYESVDAMLRVHAWDAADGIEGLNLSGFLRSTVELAAASGGRRRRGGEASTAADRGGRGAWGEDEGDGAATAAAAAAAGVDASTSVGGLPGAHRLTRTRPPYWAVDCYKTVAVDPASGRHVSIYDGVTEYRSGWTTEASGGLYVSVNPRDCLARDADLLPPGSAMLHAPREVAKCLAWNVDRMQEPVKAEGGKKLAYECVHVVAFLPHPESGALAERRHAAAASSAPAPPRGGDSGSGLRGGLPPPGSSSGGREGFRGAASLSPRGPAVGGGRPRTSGGRLPAPEVARPRGQGFRSETLLSLQAESVALSAEVAEAERVLGLRGAKVRAATNAPTREERRPAAAVLEAPKGAPERPRRKATPPLTSAGAGAGTKPPRAGALRRPLGPVAGALSLDGSNVLRGTELGRRQAPTHPAD